jgi:hypothetical protein
MTTDKPAHGCHILLVAAGLWPCVVCLLPVRFIFINAFQILRAIETNHRARTEHV